MDAPERSNIAVSASIASIATVADPGPAVLSARPTRGGDSRSPAVVAAQSSGATSSSSGSSRYESQKRRDWNTFLQYLKNQKPPLTLARCSGAHVIEFLKYLDQFGKTKVHVTGCPYFGNPNTPAPCACPLKQAWGSLDALIGRLRAAYEENGGRPESNPFGAKVVRIYLREVREGQAKARGIRYEKKKKKRKRRGSLQKAGGCGSGGGGINGDTPPQTFSAHDGAPDSGGGGRIGPTSAGPALAVATIPFPNSTV